MFLVGIWLYCIFGFFVLYGFVMENFGDIDWQFIVGVILMGMYGMGVGFGGLVMQVVGVILVMVFGEFWWIDEEYDVELFFVVVFGFGVFGIIVEVMLQCVLVFVMYVIDELVLLDDVFVMFGECVVGFDYFEFYWFLYMEVVFIKWQMCLFELIVCRLFLVVGCWIDEMLFFNGVYCVVCVVGQVVLVFILLFSWFVVKFIGDCEYMELLYCVFIQSRIVCFWEMEYVILVENVVLVFQVVCVFIV